MLAAAANVMHSLAGAVLKAIMVVHAAVHNRKIFWGKVQQHTPIDAAMLIKPAQKQSIMVHSLLIYAPTHASGLSWGSTACSLALHAQIRYSRYIGRLRSAAGLSSAIHLPPLAAAAAAPERSGPSEPLPLHTLLSVEGNVLRDGLRASARAAPTARPAAAGPAAAAAARLLS